MTLIILLYDNGDTVNITVIRKIEQYTGNVVCLVVTVRTVHILYIIHGIKSPHHIRQYRPLLCLRTTDNLVDPEHSYKVVFGSGIDISGFTIHCQKAKIITKCFTIQYLSSQL